MSRISGIIAFQTKTSNLEHDLLLFYCYTRAIFVFRISRISYSNCNASFDA